MAGEWIKMELSTPDKPEVLRMARILEIDKDAVLGKLFRVWAWFDKNTVDGHVDGVVSTDVDGIVMKAGFCSAMQQVGWFDFNDEEQWVRLSNFDRHNGETAKNRALKNKRQSKWRANVDANVDAQPSTEASTEASTREEKRRNKNNTPAKADGFCFKTSLLEAGAGGVLVADWLAVRKSKKAANTKTALEALMREVSKSGYTLDQALRICCENSWSGFKAEWVKDTKPIQLASPVSALSAEERAAIRKAELKAAREAYMAREEAATVPVARRAQ